jgi:dolichol-phosphate mannosyltransferase
MDADLQDPPEKIIDFVDELNKGYDLVFGIREERYGNPITKLMSETFWFVIRRMSGEKIPKGIAVMRIFSRRFADQFLKYGETNRFIEGIFMDISYKWTTLTIPHRKRFAGESKFNFSRKMALAIRAVLDYSDKPLEAVSIFGFAVFALGFIAAIFVLGLKIFGFDFKIGWPSMFTMLTMGFGIQLFLIGVIAKYIGNIYKEVKKRPLFSIKESTNLVVQKELIYND